MKNILILILIIFVYCDQKQKIFISGSTTVLPIISTAAEQYEKLNPDIQIIVNAGGSGVGVNQVANKKIDIGMISRDVTMKKEIIILM